MFLATCKRRQALCCLIINLKTYADNLCVSYHSASRTCSPISNSFKQQILLRVQCAFSFRFFLVVVPTSYCIEINNNKLKHVKFGLLRFLVFTERELMFMFAICRRPSVCLSSVTFVHPTQAIEIFGNVSTPFGTLAICDPSVKILRRSS